MTTAATPYVRIPISRADLYRLADCDAPIEPLRVSHLFIDVDAVREGAITLSVTNDAPDALDDHLEVDLDPAAARLLAAELLAAATRVTAESDSVGPAAGVGP